MAVTDEHTDQPTNHAPAKSPAFATQTLQAFTVAAQILLGVQVPNTGVAAEDDSADFQYSHYQEGKRNLYGSRPDSRNPIEVDSIHGRANAMLTDRIKLGFNYVQDTWSGATPIATAPLVFGGNHRYTSGTATGASPFISPPNTMYVDRNFNPMQYHGDDPNTGIGLFSQNRQLVHTLSTASPETRRQGDFRLGYEWDEAEANLGGGVSSERDYESRFVNLGGRIDFNQKLTSLNLGLSYTNSDTNALLDHDATPYINVRAYRESGQIRSTTTGTRLTGTKEDIAASLGLTQILSKDALIQADLSFTHSSGYMANPYKVMEALFVDPNQIPDLIDPFGDGKDYFSDGRPADVLKGDLRAFLEKRPTLRNQWNLGGRYVQYFHTFDAALHFDYRFSHDDWGINSHTFEADWVQPLGSGWTVTPRVRYYSQDAADFYKPYLLVNQAVSSNFTTSNDYRKLPDYYSSDQRLSGYGTLSGGISVSKQFAKGITLETGFEYYTHSGSLKIGGNGEGNYSNFNYFVANAGLKVNFSAVGAGKAGGEHHHHAHHHHGAEIPAGVMFAHMMDQADAVMVGYRYMYSAQAGDMLRGSSVASDPAIVNFGCGSANIDKCFIAPERMSMHMHMLDLMYAPTDWLNLMLMPQFVDMDMDMRQIADPAAYAGLPPPPNKLNHITHHISAGHSTGGVGDTGMYALFKLFGTPDHHVNLTLGVTAPTGDVSNRLRRNHAVDGGFNDYGMQLGSGTWDFKPALSYTGQYGEWSWGAQVNGTKRLDNKNASGYALGDIIQSTAWGSYQWLDWLSTSVRGVYTAQGAVRGQFDGLIQTMAPSDFPKNYGGQYWDVGFGVNARVLSGDLAGNSLSFEWLEPVATKQNGYQLERDAALAATWTYAF
ncbi:MULTISPECIES: DUF3570 domain-containing protein [Methylomonas]|uniref:DUF3570 domain-containing protein n=1 Tax=Methylomonas TaxID=416 RepID=UPI000A9CD4FE|nr:MULTISPECIES: DUF3570 domain-containing protein [Methylomonas]WNB76740.1 DUF3570 domain-containing protein [Methylomonas koyamae]